MKTAMVITVIATLALVGFCGCMSPRGGGLAEDTGFKISVPTFTTDVKQGDRQTISVTLQREKFFKQNVRLQTSASSGISVTPADILVKASEAPEVQLQIAAPKDAALGEYRVNVKGTPETGLPASIEIKVKVVAP
jgi:uncharacterized membrane protein